jgi:electron transfer flavoprotein alpha subunit
MVALGKEIWVLIEHRDGEIEESSLEVLCEARRLAGKARTAVFALVLGCPVEAFVDTLSQYGADTIYQLNHDLLTSYTTDGYTTVLTDLLKALAPGTFLLAAGALGRDLAPRLATRLKTSLVSDCTVLDMTPDGVLEMTRPTCGGRVYTKMTGTSGGVQIASVRPGVLGVGKALRGRKAKIEELAVALPPEVIRTRLLGVGVVDLNDLDITEAEYVLAFGRGLGDKSKLPQMQTLAGNLGACIAGSRAAVDERYVTFQRQIGQTGKTISPKVIICCGISGAQQFVMGMRESRFIISINIDRRAPIFQVSDVSVLGDLNEVVPALIDVFHPSK